MNKLIRIVFILIILILFYVNRDMAFEGIIRGINIWNNSLFPSIFPILIISDFILSSDLIYYINKIFGSLFRRLFKVCSYGSYVFIMSMFSGCPSNAKYINDLINSKVINKDEAIKILSMSLLYNPLLIIAITPYLKLNEQLFILIVNLICNIIVGLLNRNYKANISTNNYIKKNFNLVNSISNAINTLLLILGSVCLFMGLSFILPFSHPLITGIFEITSGISMINLFEVDSYYKIIFTVIMMSFGGLSILMQIKSILKDADLDYSLYYKSRIIHLVLFMLIILVLA